MSAGSNAAVALGIALALAGCGAADTNGGASSSAPGSIVVQTIYKPGGDLYVEGAVREVLLRSGSGTVIATKKGDALLRFENLSRGTYTLEPALRPCEANCGMLDERTDMCSEFIEVDQSAVRVRVTFQTGGPCQIAIAPPDGTDGAADCSRQVRLAGVVYTSNGYTDRRASRFGMAEEADCHDVGPDAAGSVFSDEPPRVVVWAFRGYSADDVVGVRFGKDRFAVFVADSVAAHDRERIYRELK